MNTTLLSLPDDVLTEILKMVFVSSLVEDNAPQNVNRYPPLALCNKRLNNLFHSFVDPKRSFFRNASFCFHSYLSSICVLDHSHLRLLDIRNIPQADAFNFDMIDIVSMLMTNLSSVRRLAFVDREMHGVRSLKYLPKGKYENLDALLVEKPSFNLVQQLVSTPCNLLKKLCFQDLSTNLIDAVCTFLRNGRHNISDIYISFMRDESPPNLPIGYNRTLNNKGYDFIFTSSALKSLNNQEDQVLSASQIVLHYLTNLSVTEVQVYSKKYEKGWIGISGHDSVYSDPNNRSCAYCHGNSCPVPLVHYAFPDVEEGATIYTGYFVSPYGRGNAIQKSLSFSNQQEVYPTDPVVSFLPSTTDALITSVHEDSNRTYGIINSRSGIQSSGPLLLRFNIQELMCSPERRNLWHESLYLTQEATQSAIALDITPLISRVDSIDGNENENFQHTWSIGDEEFDHLTEYALSIMSSAQNLRILSITRIQHFYDWDIFLKSARVFLRALSLLGMKIEVLQIDGDTLTSMLNYGVQLEGFFRKLPRLKTLHVRGLPTIPKGIEERYGEFEPAMLFQFIPEMLNALSSETMCPSLEKILFHQRNSFYTEEKKEDENMFITEIGVSLEALNNFKERRTDVDVGSLEEYLKECLCSGLYNDEENINALVTGNFRKRLFGMFKSKFRII